MRPRKYIKLALRALVSAALLYLVLRNLDWGELRQLVAGADVLWLGLVVLLFTLDRFLMAAKWGHLLAPGKGRLDFLRRLHLYYLSGVIGLGIPLGGFAPDIVRMVIARRAAGGAGTIFLSILVERIHGLAATLAVGGVAVLVYSALAPQSPFDNLPIIPEVVFGATLVGAACLSASAIYPEFYRRLARVVRWPKAAETLAGKLVALSYSLGENWRLRNLKFVFWTLVEQLFAVFCFHLTARSLDVDIGLIDAVAVVPLNALVQRLLPISFAGLGFREVTYAVLFAGIGIPVVESVGVSLVAFGMFLVSMLPGFVLLFADQKQFAEAGAGAAPVPARAPRITVFGVYGKGNWGDEALLAAVADDLRAVYGPGVEVQAFCSRPEAVARAMRIPAFGRSPWPINLRQLRAFAGSDLFVIGGGTLLCDHSHRREDVSAVVTYFFWIVLGRLLGVRSVAYGQGFGPAKSPVIRYAMRRLLPLCAAVTVRDRKSMDLLCSVARPRPRWRLSCDPVVGGDRFAVADAGKPGWQPPRNPRILVAVRRPKLGRIDAASGYFEWVGSSVAMAAQATAAEVVLFPTHLSSDAEDDRAAVELVERAIVASAGEPVRVVRADWTTIDEGALWLRSADLIVGDRLHALLMGLMAGIPVIGLDVEDKIPGCLADIDPDARLSSVLSPSGGDCSSFAAHMAAALGRSRTGSSCEGIDRYRSRHSVNFDALASLGDCHRPSVAIAAAH